MSFCQALKSGKSPLKLEIIQHTPNPRDIQAFYRELETLKDGIYEVTIKKASKEKTSPQNRYIHGVVLPWFKKALEDTGAVYTETQVKTRFKLYAELGEIVNTKKGPVFDPKSIAECSKEEVKEGLDRFNKWCADWLGATPPPPKERL